MATKTETTEQAGARVLVVDDELADRRACVEVLRQAGFGVEVAEDGEVAWRRLAAGESFQVVIADRAMPRVDGLELLRRIRGEPSLEHVPVILQTGEADAETLRRSFAAGASYHLPKPIERETLLAVVEAAVSDYSRYAKVSRLLERGIGVLALIQRATFELRTLDEATDVAGFIGKACPEVPHLGIALSELLVNAVEHGNLEITYQDKSRLNAQGRWREEVERRLEHPELEDRRVRVDFERSAGEIRLRIEDEGAGFDWHPFLEIAPDRVFDSHGRGIAMARLMGFGKLEYQGRGNVVVARIPLGANGAPAAS